MSVNQSIYRFYAPVYDLIFGWMYDRVRRRSIELLALRPGERLLISGVGTGLDLPYLPAGSCAVGVDISPEMLADARAKSCLAEIELRVMDAQMLEFPDSSFDAALLNLIVSVAPDGRAVLAEAWRCLCPGGRVVIMDKFLPEASRLTWARRLAGRVISAIGTDPNRRLSDLMAGLPGCTKEIDQPVLLRGQYRVIVLRKAAA
jgi:ubiquinone/menaquinone biosynthesis C-methylase UbiE